MLSAQDCEAGVDLSCISLINLTLNADCQANLTPAMVLSGDQSCLQALEFNITVVDSDMSNGSVIDGCGSFTFLVEEVLPEGGANIPYSCWGTVNAEDKTSAVVVALPQVPTPLYCDAIDATDISTLPSNISRCWIADGNSGDELPNTLHPALRARLLAGGGLPVFFDGCSDVEICVYDQVYDVGDCSDIIITRTFTATDGLDCSSSNGEENDPTVAAYDIVFTRPSMAQIEGVNPTAVYECDASFPLLAPNQYGDRNPEPQATDYPFFDGGNGPLYLTNNFCSIGATFEDGPRTVTCPQTYKFVRTFTVVDWCMPEEIETFTQLVKVGDFEAPSISPPVQDLDFNGEPDPGPLFFSTSNPDCSANFLIPPGDATDNCDDDPQVIAFILPNGNPNVAALGPYTVNGVALNIPFGEHVMRYIARDACDNADTLDVDIVVGDRTAPVAICEDGLDISLGGAGTAVLTAAAVDRASEDECSEITRLIAFVGEDGLPIPGTGGWQESLTLDCDMIGFVAIGLLVTDSEGNSNSCWLNVLVEDKLAPLCIAPGPITTTCDDQDILNLPQDLTAAFSNDPIGVAAQLDILFGSATALDNCPTASTEQSVLDNRNSCGVGTIIRSFVAEDAGGLTSSGICSQTISVLGVHDYSILLPADAGSESCIEPDYSGVDFFEFGCDLITTTTDIDTFSATADECYKLRISYELINWCEYGTEADPYVIPRDADGDDFLEEDTWLHVLPRDASTLTDDIAWLDQDANRANGFLTPLDLHDPNGQVFGASTEAYGTDAARGAFLYRQFIKVYDDVAPELTLGTMDEFEDFDGDCAEPVVLDFELFDACTSPAGYTATAELDAFFMDTDGNEDLNLADFVPSTSPELQPTVINNGDGTFTVSFGVALPLGLHAVRIQAADGCGNTAVALYLFEVVDAKAPSPICINGLTATLMPDGEGGGMAAIWASEYVASEVTDCNGPVKLAIYRSADAVAPDFAGPAVTDTGLVLTCDDLGLLAVRVYAIDAAGNADFCETTLMVQAFQESVCNGNGGAILGFINTEANLPVPGVEVGVSNESMNEMFLTDNQGYFEIDGLTFGADYTVDPHLDVDPLNGVTTLDLLTINFHLLDYDQLGSPYKIIAADTDDSENLTILDLVRIRMLILGLINNFEGNTSWRFVDADYNFPNEEDPWAELFPEVANFNNLEDVGFSDFVAIKIGDVNNSAVLGFDADGSEITANEEGRSGWASIYTPTEHLPAGELVEIPIYANTQDQLAGLQGTFELAEGVELVDIVAGQAKASNFGTHLLDRNWLTFSYDDRALATITDELPLVSLVLRSNEDMPLVDGLRFGSAYTEAEAYSTDLTPHHLSFQVGEAAVTASANRLYQNAPNPFATETLIGFELEKSGTARLEIRDMAGRLVAQFQREAEIGYNQFRLDRISLGQPAGWYSYTLSANDFSETRKLILQ